MCTSIKAFAEFLDKIADPRVKQWTLMGSPLPTLIIIGAYLLTVEVILPSFMKKRKAFNLTTIIRYYDILQVVLCLGLIYTALSAGYLQGKYSWGCQPIDYSNDHYALKLLNVFYWTYFVKMLELMETIFFSLRKKFSQVSSLHLYHHSSTFFLAWLVCKYIGGGMAVVPIIINSFIHVLMYTYYYLSSFGPDSQKKIAPWKSRLTILQMIQFIILILHAAIALQPSCHMPKIFILIYIPNVVLIFKMFYDFYQKSYLYKINIQGT